MEHLLKIENIEKYYGSKSSLTKAIDDISFNVDKGEFVAIMGASGSGKTTLLNCISTIDRGIYTLRARMSLRSAARNSTGSAAKSSGLFFRTLISLTRSPRMRISHLRSRYRKDLLRRQTQR